MLSFAYPHAMCGRSSLDLLLDQLHHPLRLPQLHTPAAVNLSQTEDGYLVTVAAPGVDASNLTVSCDDGVLSITGESRSNGNYARIHRELQAPPDADAEGATVLHENGLLLISLPKKPAVEPRSLGLVAPSEQPAPDDTTHYRVALPAPGIAPRDLTITLLESEVKVSGRSKPHGVEYSIDRVLHLPRDADAAGATASLVDGILTLAVPKRAHPAAKQLAIGAAPAAACGCGDSCGDCGPKASRPVAASCGCA